jgi:HNH endonuclease
MTTPHEQSYRTIPLTQGQVELVDAADFEFISQWKWYAHWKPNTRSFYAARTVNAAQSVTGKNYTAWMAREILGLKSGIKEIADHINHDTLNNRRDNLRICTPKQNLKNKRKHQKNSTGFKGIYEHGGKFMASICVDGRTIRLGSRKTAKEAHEELYVPASVKYHGEFANPD